MPQDKTLSDREDNWVLNIVREFSISEKSCSWDRAVDRSNKKRTSYIVHSLDFVSRQLLSETRTWVPAHQWTQNTNPNRFLHGPSELAEVLGLGALQVGQGAVRSCRDATPQTVHAAPQPRVARPVSGEELWSQLQLLWKTHRTMSSVRNRIALFSKTITGKLSLSEVLTQTLSGAVQRLSRPSEAQPEGSPTRTEKWNESKLCDLVQFSAKLFFWRWVVLWVWRSTHAILFETSIPLTDITIPEHGCAQLFLKIYSLRRGTNCCLNMYWTCSTSPPERTSICLWDQKGRSGTPVASAHHKMWTHTASLKAKNWTHILQNGLPVAKLRTIKNGRRKRGVIHMHSPTAQQCHTCRQAFFRFFVLSFLALQLFLVMALQASTSPPPSTQKLSSDPKEEQNRRGHWLFGLFRRQGSWNKNPSSTNFSTSLDVSIRTELDPFCPLTSVFPRNTHKTEFRRKTWHASTCN